MLPWFQYTTVYLGPVPIQVWGAFVAAGIGLSFFLLYKIAKRRSMDVDRLLDHAMWAIIVGLIGARLGYVFFYAPAFYLADPIEIFKLWHGGMSSYGGFIGAIIGFFWYAKRKGLSKKYLVVVADIMAFTAVFGWIIARVGCFMIHDHMGKPCDCFLAINTPEGPRLEMAFLEILALLPIAAAFIFLRKKRMPDGWFAAVLFAYYGLVRFTLDFFRATDIPNADPRYFGLTPAQYFSILAFAVSVGALVKIWRRSSDSAS